MITFHQILAAGITQYCNSDLRPPTVKRCSVTAEPQFLFVTAADCSLLLQLRPVSPQLLLVNHKGEKEKKTWLLAEKTRSPIRDFDNIT